MYLGPTPYTTVIESRGAGFLGTLRSLYQTPVREWAPVTHCSKEKGFRCALDPRKSISVPVEREVEEMVPIEPAIVPARKSRLARISEKVSSAIASIPPGAILALCFMFIGVVAAFALRSVKRTEDRIRSETSRAAPGMANAWIERVYPNRHGTVIECNRNGFCDVAVDGIAPFTLACRKERCTLPGSE